MARADAQAALRAELAALRRRVAELEARLDQQTEGAAATSASRPLPQAARREGLSLALYGFLSSEAAWESASTGGDRFLNLVPFGRGEEGPAEFLLSPHATRLGLRARSPGGGSERPPVGGRLEVDFDSASGAPRLRHAYVELETRWASALLGQTWAVVARLNPETVNSDNLFNLGNLYERVPQLRIAKEFESDSGRLGVEAGLLRFFGSFDQKEVDGVPLAVQQPDGSTFEVRSTGLPLLQGRIAWRSERGSAYAALSGSVGRLRVENALGRRRTLGHWLVAGELVLPRWGPLQLSAEAFWGRALGFNGGVGQSVALPASGPPRSLEGRGGFVQLALRPLPPLSCHLVAGLDDPQNEASGLPAAVRSNLTAVANCFWRLRAALDLALEVQGVRTHWDAGAPFVAQDLRVTQAVYLHF